MIILLAASAAEVFTYIGYVIVAILALMLMIVVHESGHYLAGKLLGFKIDEFSIGFGPAIFKHTNKKTGELFALRPIPLGGFCAFHGEDEESAEEKAKKNAAEMTESEVFNDGTVGLELKKGILAPKETAKDKGFNDMPAWKRLIVLFSGAFFNFLSAIFIITIYFSAYGQPLPVVMGAYDLYSGYEQYFEEGDAILAVNGKQVNIMEMSDCNKIFGGLGDSATFKVLRDGKAVEITAHRHYYFPILEEELIAAVDGTKLDAEVTFEELLGTPYVADKTELTLNVVSYDADGELQSSRNIRINKGINAEDASGWYSQGFGIVYSPKTVKLDFFRALGRSFGFSFFIVFKILASLGALITGKIGIESAGGTITVVKTIADVSALGFDAFLYVVAIISANLAVMNLLPIPALDGSRMLFTVIEMIFRKPVPRKIEAVIHTVGLVVLLLLVVFLDIFHLVSG